MTTTHIHKRTGNKLHQYKRYKNTAMYWVLNDDGSPKQMHVFNSKKTMDRKAICLNINVKAVTTQRTLF